MARKELDHMAMVRGREATHQIVPSVFAEATYLIEGQPFRFDGRTYLKIIYDSDIIDGLIKSGRQVEKSTTLSVKIGNDVLLVPHTKDMYIAPRTEQVKLFSKSRLGKLFRFSQEDIVRKYYMSPDLTEQVFFKQFTTGGEVYLKHCYGEADHIRGFSVDNLYIDEVQDIFVDAIPVIKETQSHSTKPVTWYTGTPKTFSNTIEQLWQTSTQGEWVVKCPACGMYQVLGLANIEGRTTKSPARLVCRKCKKDIPVEAKAAGFWLEKYPERSLKGFHISQLMVPWIKIDGSNSIWEKYMSYSTAKFYNEVLGLSYEDADQPFPQTLLNDVTDPNRSFLPSLDGEFAQADTFMGVDWGTGEKSFTVVTIFARNADGKLQMLYAKRFALAKEHDSMFQVSEISKLMDQFNVRLALVDWGFGFTQAQELQKKFGHRIATCYYTHNQTEKLRWDAGRQRYTVRRTDVMMDYVTLVKTHGVVWPGSIPSEMKWLHEHHRAVQAEYRPSMNGKSEEMYYTHPMTMPDDGVHACSYAYMASMLYRHSGLHQLGRPTLEFITVESF